MTTPSGTPTPEMIIATLTAAFDYRMSDTVKRCLDTACVSLKGLPASPDENKMATALAKINAIRNSIVGFQNIGWSEHIYPLVAALEEAGFAGVGYEQARKDAQTLLDEITTLRADRDRLREALKRIEREDRLEYSHARGCYAEIAHEALQSSTGGA